METQETAGQSRHYFVGLLIVVGAALALRFKGMWFGYPLALHPDEPAIVNNALRMIETGDLNPHFFNYPSLTIYFQALLSQVLMAGSQLFLDQPAANIPQIHYFIAGRAMVVLQSVLTVVATFEIGRRLLSPLTGLLAALFVSFSFLHLANSFLLTVDSPAAFWAIMATLMAALIFTRGKRTSYYLLGGIFAGLAAGSKYTAVVGIVPILIAHIVQSRKDGRWLDWPIVFSLAAVVVTFLLTTPYALLDFPSFMAAIRFEAEHYRTGHTGAESSGRTSFVNYGRYLIEDGYGWLPMILAGLGAIWLSMREPAKAVLLLAAPLLLFLFVGQYKVFFPRNIVMVIPYLALFSGYFVASAYEWLRVRVSVGPQARLPVGVIVAVAAVLVVASIYPQAARGLSYVERITLPDTRWASVAWLRDNLPAGSTVGREHYTPPLEGYTNDLDVTYLGYNAVAANPELVEQFDYMIVSEGDYGRFFNAPETYPQEAAAYDEFFSRNELIREFVADGQTLNGPTIRVYRIRQTADNGSSY